MIIKPSALYLSLSATIGAVFAISAGVFANDSVDVNIQGQGFRVCSRSAADALARWEFVLVKVRRETQGRLVELVRIREQFELLDAPGVRLSNKVFAILSGRVDSIHSRIEILARDVREIDLASSVKMQNLTNHPDDSVWADSVWREERDECRQGEWNALRLLTNTLPEGEGLVPENKKSLDAFRLEAALLRRDLDSARLR